MADVCNLIYRYGYSSTTAYCSLCGERHENVVVPSPASSLVVLRGQHGVRNDSPAFFLVLLAYPISGFEGGSAQDVLATEDESSTQLSQGTPWTPASRLSGSGISNVNCFPNAAGPIIDTSETGTRPTPLLTSKESGLRCTVHRRPWPGSNCKRCHCSENSRGNRKASRGEFLVQGPVSCKGNEVPS